MKVLLVNTDGGGSMFYRLTAPVNAVIANDLDVDIRLNQHIQVDAVLDTVTKKTTVKHIDEDVDLIVVQRPLAQDMHSMILQARRQGIATAVEIDDDFESVHPRNRAYASVQEIANPVNNKTWLKRSCEDADAVFVSTPRLARVYASHGRSRVLPNYVPESLLDTETPLKGGSTVGWSGTLQTHPTDLQTTGGAIGRVLKDTGTGFYAVGDGNGIGTALGLSYSDHIDASGWLPMEDYYPTIKSKIGVGIVPLDDIPFNQAKSWLKGLEFAALGIPFVASPTEEYQALHKLGIGELASSPSEWRKKVGKLVEDGRRRVVTGERYRDKVRDSLTYEVHAHKWLEAWEYAVSMKGTK